MQDILLTVHGIRKVHPTKARVSVVAKELVVGANELNIIKLGVIEASIGRPGFNGLSNWSANHGIKLLDHNTDATQRKHHRHHKKNAPKTYRTNEV